MDTKVITSISGEEAHPIELLNTFLLLFMLLWEILRLTLRKSFKLCFWNLFGTIILITLTGVFMANRTILILALFIKFFSILVLLFLHIIIFLNLFFLLLCLNRILDNLLFLLLLWDRVRCFLKLLLLGLLSLSGCLLLSSASVLLPWFLGLDNHTHNWWIVILYVSYLLWT